MTETKNDDTTAGPHGRISCADARERFTAELFDRMWDRYRGRVSYVADYERVITAAGATFVNDHIAFRTFAGQNPQTGISSLSRIFVALGYRAAGCYCFEDKHLDAIHLEHPNPDFPKLFISELRISELREPSREILSSMLESHRPAISVETLAALAEIEDCNESQREKLLDEAADEFQTRPWTAPEKDAVVALNEESQYAAWVAVHGYDVNHFTSLINSHGVENLADIDKTVAALITDGVPMKASVEGAPGSKLRQTATEAVVIDVEVTDGGSATTMPWTYAYFELAERGMVTDPRSGAESRFEGFLGAQATHLFEMTRNPANNS